MAVLSHRALKLEETFSADGAILHEIYFDILGGPGGAPTGSLADRINADFGSFDAFVEALIWKNDGVPWNSWMKILTYDWHTAYRKQLAMISESEGPIMDLLDRLGGQTYHHDFNGWELLTSELLYWMNHNRWPRNENDHRSQFKNITKKQDSYAKKLSKYVREFALGVSD